MSGGREMPIFIRTSADDGFGKKIAAERKSEPRSSFFILLPPLAIAKTGKGSIHWPDMSMGVSASIPQGKNIS